MNKPGGARYAVGSRLYDPKTNRWTIYWANDGEGEWQSPARGGSLSSDGIVVIYDDVWGDRAVLTRYQWATANVNAPRWEQSLSADCGATWVSNWVMEFARVTQRL